MSLIDKAIAAVKAAGNGLDPAVKQAVEESAGAIGLGAAVIADQINEAWYTYRKSSEDTHLKAFVTALHNVGTGQVVCLDISYSQPNNATLIYGIKGVKANNVTSPDTVVTSVMLSETAENINIYVTKQSAVPIANTVSKAVGNVGKVIDFVKGAFDKKKPASIFDDIAAQLESLPSLAQMSDDVTINARIKATVRALGEGIEAAVVLKEKEQEAAQAAAAEKASCHFCGTPFISDQDTRCRACNAVRS